MTNIISAKSLFIIVFVVDIILLQRISFASELEMYTKIIYPTIEEIANHEIVSKCNSYTDHLVIRNGDPNETMMFEQNDPIVSAIVQCGEEIMWEMDPVVHYDAAPGDWEMWANVDGTPLQSYGVKTKCAFLDYGEIIGYRAPAHIILVCIDHKSIGIPEK